MMTREEVTKLVDNTPYARFPTGIKNPLATRGDLHAFVLLDKLMPAKCGDIISAAEHDEIFLNIDIDKLLEVLTPELVVELSNCGVNFDFDNDCLQLFV